MIGGLLYQVLDERFALVYHKIVDLVFQLPQYLLSLCPISVACVCNMSAVFCSFILLHILVS